MVSSNFPPSIAFLPANPAFTSDAVNGPDFQKTAENIYRLNYA